MHRQAVDWEEAVADPARKETVAELCRDVNETATVYWTSCRHRMHFHWCVSPPLFFCCCCCFCCFFCFSYSFFVLNQDPFTSQVALSFLILSGFEFFQPVTTSCFL